MREPLWEGDTGDLDNDTRRVLATLVVRRQIDRAAGKGKELWKVLLARRDAIEAALCNLYLTLRVDEEYEVAYALPATLGEDLEGVSVKRNLTFNCLETVLLVALAGKVIEHRAAGRPPDSWTVCGAELESKAHIIESFHEERNSEKRDGALKRVMDKFVTNEYVDSLLEGETVRDSEWLIRPLLPSVMTPERIRILARDLERMQTEASESGKDQRVESIE